MRTTPPLGRLSVPACGWHTINQANADHIAPLGLKTGRGPECDTIIGRVNEGDFLTAPVRGFFRFLHFSDNY